ncbi:hypothetical protein [Prosthecobacter sp.]|uniref:hypothetical protein n=1 Tax=Prosthecobacter sp. TaxID=1965333 RepID=UPI0037831AB6
MTKAEYDQCEQIALEQVDWLFTKTNNSHIILTVLMRSLCLFLAQTRRKGSTIAEITKQFSKAFTQEMQGACAFVDKQKGAKG